MSHYIHTITPIEEACGVTLERVGYYLARGVFFDVGRAWTTDAPSPALALSVARAAFAGRPLTYAGLNSMGWAVYRLQS